ncbi:hypothetical protein ACHAXT_005140 [Thalassiosira profunda]
MEGEDPIPVDVLIEEYNALKDGHRKTLCIIRSTLALVSVIASSTLIWMLRRSRDRFATCQHRILLGLSIADILFSLSLAHFNFPAPTDVDYYVWNAQGNEASCSASGFLTMLGAGSGLTYIVSLNVYYLLVIRYGKTEDFIRRRIEPFLHGLPVAIPLAVSCTLLATNNFNDDGAGNCHAPIYNPPHCTGYEDGEVREGFEIACGRGSDGAVTFYYIFSFVVLLLVPILVIICLGLIYRTVSKQEKKMARWSRNTPFSSNPSSTSTDDQRRISGTAISRSFLHRQRTPQTDPRNTSKSRAVMLRAFSYSAVYFLAWTFFIIGKVLDVLGNEIPLAISYLTNILNPLQGLFNWLVYMQPRVMLAKRRGGDIGWCKAFGRAFWSHENGPGASLNKVRPKEAEERTRVNNEQTSSNAAEEEKKVEIEADEEEAPPTRHR